MVWICFEPWTEHPCCPLVSDSAAGHRVQHESRWNDNDDKREAEQHAHRSCQQGENCAESEQSKPSISVDRSCFIAWVVPHEVCQRQTANALVASTRMRRRPVRRHWLRWMRQLSQRARNSLVRPSKALYSLRNFSGFLPARHKPRPSPTPMASHATSDQSPLPAKAREISDQAVMTSKTTETGSVIIAHASQKRVTRLAAPLTIDAAAPNHLDVVRVVPYPTPCSGQPAHRQRPWRSRHCRQIWWWHSRHCRQSLWLPSRLLPTKLPAALYALRDEVFPHPRSGDFTSGAIMG